jgi:hypothetical protein
MKPRIVRALRKAFTLIELLIVITPHCHSRGFVVAFAG